MLILNKVRFKKGKSLYVRDFLDSFHKAKVVGFKRKLQEVDPEQGRDRRENLSKDPTTLAFESEGMYVKFDGFSAAENELICFKEDVPYEYKDWLKRVKNDPANDDDYTKIKRNLTVIFPGSLTYSCVCGEQMTIKKAGECYNFGGCVCDGRKCASEGKKTISGTELVFNCPGGYNQFHSNGYDLCFDCVLRQHLVTDEMLSD